MRLQKLRSSEMASVPVHPKWEAGGDQCPGRKTGKPRAGTSLPLPFYSIQAINGSDEAHLP